MRSEKLSNAVSVLSHDCQQHSGRYNRSGEVSNRRDLEFTSTEFAGGSGRKPVNYRE